MKAYVKFSTLVLTILLAGYLFNLIMARREDRLTIKPQLIQEADLYLSASQINNIPSYNFPSLSQYIESAWTIIIYVPELSCRTCVSRDVVYANDMVYRYPVIDFIMIANTDEEYYLRNLVRIGKISYPILVYPKDLPPLLGERFSISLYDVVKQKIVLQYFPSPDPKLEQVIVEFDRRVAAFLED